MQLGRSFHSTEPLYLKLFFAVCYCRKRGCIDVLFPQVMPGFLDRFDHVIQVRWALLDKEAAKYFVHLQCYLSHSIELERD